MLLNSYFCVKFFKGNSNLLSLNIPIQHLNSCNMDRSKLQRKRKEIEIKLYFSQNAFYLVYIVYELTNSGLLLNIFL